VSAIKGDSPNAKADDGPEHEGPAEDGLSLGLLGALLVAVVAGIGMVAFIFPGILALVPLSVGLMVLLGMQVLIYRLFGLRIRGRQETGRRPGPPDSV